jgi:integrase
MEISDTQNFCIYCKRKLVTKGESFHSTCYNEIYLFNQNSLVNLNTNNYQIRLLTLILANTSLHLQDTLALKKNNIDLENRQIIFYNKTFKLSDSICTELESIFEKFSFSENLFSITISYPSRYSISCIKKVGLLN